jgi:hypothetical protein
MLPGGLSAKIARAFAFSSVIPEIAVVPVFVKLNMLAVPVLRTVSAFAPGPMI